MSKLISILGFLLLINGCASISPITKKNPLVLPELSKADMVIEENGKKRPKTRIEILTTARKIPAPTVTLKPVPIKEQIPVPTTPITRESENFELDYSKKLYKFWMNYYLKRDRKRFQRHMNRGHKVETIVRETFKKHHLPEDLFFVGLIESGYNERISSHANAVGPWQFIKGTATRYGLRVDRYIDERFNIVKASEASAQYFKDLYNIFGSWELALCAYNAGEYRIINAIRRGNTRDYRELVRKKLLPKETIYYVPKVMAARTIYESRKNYGFRKPASASNPFKNASTSTFKSSFSLNKVAKKIGVSYHRLKKMNPDIKTGWVHIKRGRSHELLVPSSKENTAVKIAKSYREKARKPEAKRLAKLRSKIKAKIAAYKVQKGDNLTRIARMFNTNIRTIKKANKLKTSNVYIGQRIKIPGLRSKVYTVRRGDNLGQIARKFRTTIASIKGLNGLRNSRIYPKQKIQIPVKS
ncbi:MAG: hypothetical protein CME70_13375 [Halobacteriovorax sp.]|nr:hypothetical protein [Halobacteriovorax sp.]